MTYSRIAGTGSYLPEKILTNTDLENMVETSDEWIVSRTGIRERRIVNEDETTASLAEEACRRAQVAAARLAHIGDEPGTDLAGAQNAKVTGIWMNRRGQTADPVIAHHAEIRNMTELLSLLGAD